MFLDDVTVSRNHALLVRRRDGLYLDDLGSLNGTYVNRRRIESHKLAERRRAAGRQVQADLPGALRMDADANSARPPGRHPSRRSGRAQAMTIGAVCNMLRREFPDISISKIRYLEDQKLLSPRRTQGGYRLYSPADVARLRTILRLQRDEFLPLRVIRQELAAGAHGSRDRASESADDARPRRMADLERADRAPHSLDDVLEYSGADERLLRELEEYGVIDARAKRDARVRRRSSARSSAPSAELTRYGVAARNLRVFRTSADREAALLEQILGPALRSRNRERRREAIDDAREPRRRRVAAQAPAAGARPAQAGRLRPRVRVPKARASPA